MHIINGSFFFIEAINRAHTETISTTRNDVFYIGSILVSVYPRTN